MLQLDHEDERPSDLLPRRVGGASSSSSSQAPPRILTWEGHSQEERWPAPLYDSDLRPPVGASLDLLQDPTYDPWAHDQYYPGCNQRAPTRYTRHTWVPGVSRAPRVHPEAPWNANGAGYLRAANYVTGISEQTGDLVFNVRVSSTTGSEGARHT